MSYDSELYRLQSELRRTKAELRAEREAHHAFKISVAKEKLLQANAADCDVRHVEAMIDGGKPRVDADGNVIMSYGPDDSLVGTFEDVMSYWRDRPAEFGNIVGIQKHEPTARERLEAKFRDMPMDEYSRRRKSEADFYEPPPPDPQE